jgi:hypothetical protein
MIYINRRTGIKVELSSLDAQRQEFYKKAHANFRKNVSWADFEDFAFGMGSPLYAQRTSHLEVLSDPLYEALTDMWLELGVRQGLIASEQSKEKRTRAQRGSQDRSRQAADQRNATEDSKLAASHSFARSHA